MPPAPPASPKSLKNKGNSKCFRRTVRISVQARVIGVRISGCAGGAEGGRAQRGARRAWPGGGKEGVAGGKRARGRARQALSAGTVRQRSRKSSSGIGRPITYPCA